MAEKIRKVLSYEVKLKLTNFLGTNAKRLNGKTVAEITAEMQEKFGHTYDNSTIKRQCQVFNIKLARGSTANGVTYTALMRKNLLETIDVLTTMGDVLSRVLDACGIKSDVREVQMARLLEASDKLDQIVERLKPQQADSQSPKDEA